MKKIRFIFFCIFGLIGCSKNQSIDPSENRKDSVNLFLDFANRDSIPLESRNSYNKKAYLLLIKRPNDSLNRANLFKVANRFYNNSSLIEYKKVSGYILKKAEVVKDSNSLAKANVYLGDFYRTTTKTDSAYIYYLKGEKLYFALGDQQNLASINLKKAAILFEETDYFGAQKSALDVLKYLRESGNSQQLYEALAMLGLVTNAMNDYDSALAYLKKALVVIKDNNLQLDNPVATTLNNIGNVYQNSGNNKLAIQEFERALRDQNLRSENPILYSILLDNLAYSKYKSKSSRKEITSLFFESLRVKDSLNNLTGIVYSKTRLAEYYFSIDKTDSAIKLLTEAYSLADSGGSIGDKLFPLRFLSSYDLINGPKFSKIYIKINDSIVETERKIKDKFARIQFETEEISLQKDKLEEKNRNLLLFFVGTVMIALLLFVIRTQRAKNRELMLKQSQQKANEDIYNLMLSQQNKIEEGRIKEKKRIAQELHDGVLSRLFGARLNLDSLNKMDGDEAMDKRNNYLTELKNIEQDIREISHDLNREKFILINNFLAILNNLFEEQASNFEPEVETLVDDTIEWDKVNNNLKINIYRIIQEGFQNINKYAKATKIKVKLEQDFQKSILLNVEDNGLGFVVDKKSRGIGLSNMLSRTAECNGVFDIQSKKGKGTTISISFPLGVDKNEVVINTIEPMPLTN